MWIAHLNCSSESPTGVSAPRLGVVALSPMWKPPFKLPLWISHSVLVAFWRFWDRISHSHTSHHPFLFFFKIFFFCKESSRIGRFRLPSSLWPLCRKGSKMVMSVEREKRSVSKQIGEEEKEGMEHSNLLFRSVVRRLCDACLPTLTCKGGESNWWLWERQGRNQVGSVVYRSSIQPDKVVRELRVGKEKLGAKIWEEYVLLRTCLQVNKLFYY